MLKKMPGLDKSKEESRSITTIQVGLSHLLKILHLIETIWVQPSGLAGSVTPNENVPW